MPQATKKKDNSAGCRVTTGKHEPSRKSKVPLTQLAKGTKGRLANLNRTNRGNFLNKSMPTLIGWSRNEIDVGDHPVKLARHQRESTRMPKRPQQAALARSAPALVRWHLPADFFRDDHSARKEHGEAHKGVLSCGKADMRPNSGDFKRVPPKPPPRPPLGQEWQGTLPGKQ